MAFVKLDAGILNSTIWVLRPDLELFITALLMATPVQFEEPTPTIKIRTLDAADFVVPPGWYGFVEAAGPGIISRAHIDIERGLEALERLASPEPESRSQEFEGRRMVRVNGGYVVLNFMRYRDKDHTAAERQRRLRARRKGQPVTGDSNDVTRDSNVTSRIVTQSEIRDQRSERERSWVDREVARTLPQELDNPEFRKAWEKWLVYWADKKHASMPQATADSHLEMCRKLGSNNAIMAIENAIHHGFGAPCPPNEKGSRNGGAPAKPARVRIA